MDKLTGIAIFCLVFLSFLHMLASAQEKPVMRFERVYDCRELGDSFTYYFLMNNVYSDGICFNVTGDNIVLDGSGHDIRMQGGSGGIDEIVGIFVEDVHDVRVTDARIFGFNQGIVFRNVSSSKIEYIDSISNAFSGISLYGSTENEIGYNAADENGEYGILIKESSGNRIIENSASENTLGLWSGTGTGISLESSPGNFIEKNEVTYNDFGIVLYQSDNNHLLRNKARHNLPGAFNTGYGIKIVSSSENLLNKNLIEYNDKEGIYLISSTDNILTDNYLGRNNKAGIHLKSSSGNSLNKNLIEYNEYGIFLLDSQDNDISEETIFSPFIDGVHIAGNSPGNLLSNIRVSGIYYSEDLNVNSTETDGTLIKDNLFARYFILGAKLTFEERYGQIMFLRQISGEGNDLGREIRIGHNRIVIDSRENQELNEPSKLTFYEMPGNFGNPAIYRNGRICPPELCEALSSLNDETVVIRVAKSGVYEILEL